MKKCKIKFLHSPQFLVGYRIISKESCYIRYNSTKILGFTKFFVDISGKWLYIFTHKFKLSDEKKSKQKRMPQRAFAMVQGSAGNFAEDGLGADWLNLDSLGRPGAPVIVLEY